MAVSAAELNKLVETVVAAAKKAEQGDAAEQGRALDGLKALKKARVGTKVLAETQAGKRVKALAKHPKAEVAAAAAAAVAAWKEAVRAEAAAGNGGSAPPSETTSSRPPSQPSSRPPSQLGSVRSAERPGSAAGSQAAVAPPAPPPIDPESVPRSGDPIRDKCRQNLAAAFQLAVAEGVEGDPVACAVAVESEVFAQHSGVTQAYKAKFRNLHFNLKDAANPDLRRKVLCGEVSPGALLQLPAEELASDAKRLENARIREKKLFDSAPSAAKQATTDQFQCGKCRQRKTTYYQMQTRSADEPMTTFVTCLNCNNRWKFC